MRGPFATAGASLSSRAGVARTLGVIRVEDGHEGDQPSVRTLGGQRRYRWGDVRTWVSDSRP
jgi:hypothetical protein